MFDQPEPKPNKFVVFLKVLGVLAILAGCGWVLYTRMQDRGTDPAEDAARAEAEARKSKEEMLTDFAAKTVVDNADELEGKAVALEAAAVSLSGNDRLFCNGAANILRKLIPFTEAYREAFEMGGIMDVMDVSTANSVGDIRLRLEHLAHLQRVLNRQEAQFEMLEHNLRKEFRELGAAPTQGEHLVKMAMTSFGPAASRRRVKWQIQRDACTHATTIMNQLKETWGRWAVVDDEIVFEEAHLTRTYNGTLEFLEQKLQEDAEFNAKKDIMVRK
ncbi:MAG: hypothetical protein ACPGVU_07315 [Limisphaerales bacterium]